MSEFNGVTLQEVQFKVQVYLDLLPIYPTSILFSKTQDGQWKGVVIK